GAFGRGFAGNTKMPPELGEDRLTTWMVFGEDRFVGVVIDQDARRNLVTGLEDPVPKRGVKVVASCVSPEGRVVQDVIKAPPAVRLAALVQPIKLFQFDFKLVPGYVPE